VRGGAWDLGETYTRVCNRGGAGVQDVDGNLGFRAVQDLSNPNPSTPGDEPPAPADEPDDAEDEAADTTDEEAAGDAVR